MPKIVVDASAVIDALLGAEIAIVVGARLFDPALSMHAPVTIDAEFVHALRRKWIAGRATDGEAVRAIAFFRTMNITRHPVEPLVVRMWHLRQNITAYDAAYVALAESLDAPLITRDARLSRSAGHSARIEYVE